MTTPRTDSQAVRRLADRLAGIERDVKTLKDGARAPRLQYSSIENGNIKVRDGNGTLRHVSGLQEDGTITSIDRNAPPPPQPTDPILTAVPHGFWVDYDGGFVAGQVRPLDLLGVEVHVDLGAGFTPTGVTLDAVLLDSTRLHFTTGQLVPHYVRLVAVNRSGTRSTPTTELAVTPLPLPAGAPAPDSVGAVHLQNGAVTAPALTQQLVLATQIIIGTLGAARIDINGATNEITAYRADGVTSTFHLDADTGDLTLTGVYKTAPNGERITINEDSNVIRFYRTDTAFATLARFAEQIMLRSELDAGNAGHLWTAPGYSAISHGAPSSVQSSQLSVFPTYIYPRSPEIVTEVDRRYPNRTGVTPGLYILHRAADGTYITDGEMQFKVKANGAAWVQVPGNNSGWVFEIDRIYSVGNDGIAQMDIGCRTLYQSSGRASKTNIEDLPHSARAVLRAAPVKLFEFIEQERLDTRLPDPGEVVPDGQGWRPGKPRKPEPVVRPPARKHVGPMAEDLPPEIVDEYEGQKIVDTGSLIGYTIGAFQEQDDEIVQLRRRVEELEARMPPPLPAP